jgi:hypothetical protein
MSVADLRNALPLTLPTGSDEAVAPATEDGDNTKEDACGFVNQHCRGPLTDITLAALNTVDGARPTSHHLNGR